MKMKLLDILREGIGIVPYPFKNKKNIKIINGNGEEVLVDCEIASTPEETEQGLLHRESLDDGCGMLFDSDGYGSYHMVGMEFPIEMLFIDDYQIIDIIKAKPGDDNISPNGNFTQNLEVKDGFCEENNIKIGDKIQY